MAVGRQQLQRRRRLGGLPAQRQLEGKCSLPQSNPLTEQEECEIQIGPPAEICREHGGSLLRLESESQDAFLTRRKRLVGALPIQLNPEAAGVYETRNRPSQLRILLGDARLGRL